MATPAEKAHALEDAVAAIERHILKTSPTLREKTFVIESRKIVNLSGVHHEIDIFVTIDSAPGYRSVFIFECKNWTDSVGKNEVVVFSEKIDAAHAQQGYFVARSFTKDAKAQARKDPRMTLLLAKEHDPAGMPVPFGFHGLHLEIVSIQAEFKARNPVGPESATVDLATAQAVLDGQAIKLDDYLTKWAQETCTENTRTFPSQRYPEGTYDRTAAAIREFVDDEFVIDGEPVKKADIAVAFKAHVLRPRIISYYEVESRGRSLAFAPVAFAGSEMQIRLVTAVHK